MHKVWWGTHRDWGNAFLEALTPLAVSLTIMNYRTDPAALEAGASPFLAWASRHGRPVSIALELGPVADETRLHYRAAGQRGELWILPMGQNALWLLLTGPVANLPGHAYLHTHATDVSGNRTSFAGDFDRLEAIIQSLLPLWENQAGFSGLALHGLDSPR